MTIKHILLVCSFLFFSKAFSQFKVDADIRPRFEYRHGFGNLFPDNADPAAFVVQRTRLNLNYKIDKLTIMMSFQDVSTWGDTRQIDPADSNNSFSLFQGWIHYDFDDNWSTKLGRQVLSYDDQRIFGGLDWAMQGRFHDAALIKYNKGSFKADLGFAFSQENQRQLGTDFNLSGAFTYKAMQFAYLKKDWDKLSASFLFLNNGFQKFTGDDNDIPDGVFYRQTTGTYFSFPIDAVKLNGSAYYQFGKANDNTNLAAYQVALEANYKPNKTLFGLGLELLSGTNQDGDSKNKSFFPLYGTNHKFNGFMDYFYVGNHANNVGLNDLYAKAVFKTSEKSSLLVKGHYFSANAALSNNADSYLGTELDLVYTHKLMPFATLNVGYSHLFASDSMSLVKAGRPNDNTNNWAWVQLKVTPTLFNSAQKKQNNTTN
ncbi:alginate export family protein [uncultured Lacinutrix sp.]|uniref:alginate export family protein n=1 Tax=uncultured Lacinutrix sp. TaxID=574032 RepID=UPI002606DE61|nr:alginate export family protein [uncultured Lacinutrix sp.]